MWLSLSALVLCGASGHADLTGHALTKLLCVGLLIFALHPHHECVAMAEAQVTSL